jgi:hypothetical protein
MIKFKFRNKKFINSVVEIEDHSNVPFSSLSKEKSIKNLILRDFWIVFLTLSAVFSFKELTYVSCIWMSHKSRKNNNDNHGREKRINKKSKNGRRKENKTNGRRQKVISF